MHAVRTSTHTFAHMYTNKLTYRAKTSFVGIFNNFCTTNLEELAALIWLLGDSVYFAGLWAC
eukprot:TRINITY_DN7409_c0_g1_i1.p1 TRINITY_DN7409_c0_g1~~TRINITY_DN7409_c0_g1_i1.p1  ORF type:complete len:62 (-),score=6.60 TRINITY_DN7409_c0_g1_i1:62-247(-)